MSDGADGADGQVLRDAAAGDRAAARRLIEEVAPVVYGYVYVRVAGNESAAEDIVQDTFLEAVRSAGTFRGDASLTTWMCTIARRRLSRWYERERKQAAVAERAARVALVPLAGGSGGGDGDGTAALDERDAVVRALRRVSALHRQVLVLKYLDDRSVAEIAEHLGRSRVQIQSLLQRGRDALRRELEAMA